MPAYFFDSSAIVKRYVKENGSAWVISKASPATGTRIYIASITGVEVVAALARKRKGKLVSSLAAAEAVSLFHHDFANQYRIIEISDSVVARAMALAEAHALRGYDAVQLGAVLEVNRRRTNLGAPPLTFVTGDGELLTAAAAEGLLTDNPNTH